MSVYLAGELLRLKKLKKKLLSKEHNKDDDGKDVFKNLFGKDYWLTDSPAYYDLTGDSRNQNLVSLVLICY